MATNKPSIYRESALRKLSSPEDLDYLLKVTPLQSWVFLAAMGTLLLAGFAWATWGKITTTVEATGVLVDDRIDAEAPGSFEALAFVSLAEAQALRPGQPVQVLPYGASRDEHGYLQGSVASVASEAASRSRMTALLGSSAFVDSYVSAERLFAVRVSLQRDAEGAYVWTASDEPDVTLAPGLPVTLSVIVREDTPISRLLAQANE